jgi:hypothetical protein
MWTLNWSLDNLMLYLIRRGLSIHPRPKIDMDGISIEFACNNDQIAVARMPYLL